MLYLRITGDDLVPRVVELFVTEVSVGSAPDNHVVLPGLEPHQLHFQFREGGIVFVQDRGSRIAAYRGGHAIRQATLVSLGEALVVGPYEIVPLEERDTDVDMSTDASAPETPRVAPPTARYSAALEHDDDAEVPTRPNPLPNASHALLASDRTSDPEERAFLSTLEANPSSDATRAVYADWLEAKGRIDESTLLRFQLRAKEVSPSDPVFRQLSEMIRELAPRVDPVWRRTVATSVLENCHLRYDLVCPRQWASLEATEAPDQRYCTSCEKRVYYAGTLAEAQDLAEAGACVAVDLTVIRLPGDLKAPQPPSPHGRLLGAIAPRPPPPWRDS